MAPSRALLRCKAPVRLQYRPTPRLLSTLRYMPNTPYTAPCSTDHYPNRPALHLGPLRHFPAFATSRRSYSQTSSSPEPPDYLNEAELHVFNKIKAELQPVKLEVQDISGGCGSMYALEIESPRFKGLTVIKQHKMVNAVLADEIKSWHGVQLRTKAV